jgi:DNA repair protein RecO (recombination protein O)
MQFTDDAIVLSSTKYGESSGIACILTENYGIYKGLVRGVTGSRQRGLYQPGNIIEATWRARLAEHLGNLTAGLINAGGVAVMDHPIKLAALSAICSMLEATLQERERANEIYQSFKSFITELSGDQSEWQKSYVLLELELLTQLGFGLDLTSCAATGVLEDLIYVSPKSGRAVCRDAGLPYSDKLLKLPEFLISSSRGMEKTIASQIHDGIDLCSYFLDKYFFQPHNLLQPHARARFTIMLKKTLSSELA